MESILTSIKKLLGISEEDENFDIDITLHINSVLWILTQLGVGPQNGFAIDDKTAMWTDFVSDDISFASIKSYVYMKVKLLFDPPSSAALIESFNRLTSEFEWRNQVAADSAGGNTT